MCSAGCGGREEVTRPLQVRITSIGSDIKQASSCVQAVDVVYKIKVPDLCNLKFVHIFYVT